LSAPTFWYFSPNLMFKSFGPEFCFRFQLKSPNSEWCTIFLRFFIKKNGQKSELSFFFSWKWKQRHLACNPLFGFQRKCVHFFFQLGYFSFFFFEDEGLKLGLVPAKKKGKLRQFFFWCVHLSISCFLPLASTVYVLKFFFKLFLRIWEAFLPLWRSNSGGVVFSVELWKQIKPRSCSCLRQFLSSLLLDCHSFLLLFRFFL